MYVAIEQLCLCVEGHTDARITVSDILVKWNWAQNCKYWQDRE